MPFLSSKERESTEYTPLLPLHFFSISTECRYCKPSPFPAQLARSCQLSNTSELGLEDSFAKVKLAWNRDGLLAEIDCSASFEKCSYPNIEEGDSVELFIDTRDVKTSGYNTRFCHHFFFLPEPLDGVAAGEITHFRTEDSHSLCDSKKLLVKTEIKRRGYLMSIFIPSECLHGYDPDQFDRLGFTYRINRFDAESQHFSVSSHDFPIEQQPSLWASLKLVQL